MLWRQWREASVSSRPSTGAHSSGGFSRNCVWMTSTSWPDEGPVQGPASSDQCGDLCLVSFIHFNADWLSRHRIKHIFRLNIVTQESEGNDAIAKFAPICTLALYEIRLNETHHWSSFWVVFSESLSEKASHHFDSQDFSYKVAAMGFHTIRTHTHAVCTFNFHEKDSTYSLTYFETENYIS